MFLNNHHYILSSYTLALLYQYVQLYLFGYLFILLMQLVNGAQVLNITFLAELLAAAPAAAVLLADIFPLTSIYSSL